MKGGWQPPFIPAAGLGPPGDRTGATRAPTRASRAPRPLRAAGGANGRISTPRTRSPSSRLGQAAADPQRVPASRLLHGGAAAGANGRISTPRTRSRSSRLGQAAADPQRIPASRPLHGRAASGANGSISAPRTRSRSSRLGLRAAGPQRIPALRLLHGGAAGGANGWISAPRTRSRSSRLGQAAGFRSGSLLHGCFTAGPPAARVGVSQRLARAAARPASARLQRIRGSLLHGCLAPGAQRCF